MELSTMVLILREETLSITSKRHPLVMGEHGPSYGLLLRRVSPLSYSALLEPAMVVVVLRRDVVMSLLQ